MTSQEEAMLNDLVRKINSTSLQEKDDAAERLLNNGLGHNQDAMYMLAQTVLVQNIALEQAKQQMMALQQAAPPQPAKATSFLGSLLGHRDPQPSAPPVSQGYQPVQYAQQQGQQFAPSSPAAFQPQAGGQSSFLRSAATTAAGVAAGALAFQGVESLLHGGGGGGFGGGGFGGGGFGGGDGGFGGAPREEVINNYYDSPAGGSSGPDEQPQGPFDSGAQDSGNYGDDFTDGGGDFGGDDTSNF